MASEDRQQETYPADGDALLTPVSTGDNEQPPGTPGTPASRKIRRTLLLVMLVPLLLSGWMALYAFQSGPRQEEEYTIVTIPPGSGIRGIRQILAESELIHDDVRFFFLVKVLGLAKRLPAGEFRLPHGKTPGDLLRLLAVAKPVQHAVTIPEGLRLEEVADLFAAGSWCDREHFIALAHDRDFIASFGIKANSLEGYLYPDTYHLTHDLRDTQSLLAMQVKRFFQVWSDLSLTHPQSFSQHEVVTLASVVEKETGAASERPIIAGVFLNRLKSGMRLQSDPTVIYGLKNFNGDLTRSDLKNEHPYNTYVIPGLPAGPICNPGKKSMEAVLRPTASDYLYFVAKNNGRHQFSTNLDDHNRAVREYQLAEKPEKK